MLAAKTTVAGAYGVLVTGASVAVATVACVVTEAVHGGAVHAGSTTAWAGVIRAVALGGRGAGSPAVWVS